MAWHYTLAEFAAMVGAECAGLDGTFSGVSTDTRTLAPGQLFFALRGVGQTARGPGGDCGG